MTRTKPGPGRVSITYPGSKTVQYELQFNPSQSARLGTTLEAASVSETVNVTSSGSDLSSESRRIDDQVRKEKAAQLNTPSQNVFNLQRRIAGILPVRVDVPRARKSYRFVRPLVMDEETKLRSSTNRNRKLMRKETNLTFV